MTDPESLPPLPLPEGVTESYVDCKATCGLKFHILESGRTPDNSTPLIVLVHGYPELAFTWRKIMPALAAAGFHVIALDQRGYGRTSGWDTRPFDQVDLFQFRLTQLARDILAVVTALGYDHVHSIVGHDFGGVSAATCALIRPDFFKSVVIMSHPFAGSPSLPFGTGRTTDEPGSIPKKPKTSSKPDAPRDPDIQSSLAKLSPPRKHYKWYNSTPSAAKDWDNPAQGMLAFMRGYIHLKSALYPPNKPYYLGGWTAPELAKMPHYYIMPLELSMPETVALDMEGQDADATKAFLPDEELAVYVKEYSRNGFQGGLNWYRSVTHPEHNKEMILFADKKIECPSTFISGSSDWGNCQEPGALEGFNDTCSDFRGVTLVDGAGHWPQQEQPQKVIDAILAFLKTLKV